MLTFYAYKGCDSCRKARKWLHDHDITFQEIAIREQPPTLAELTLALNIKTSLKPLFNTSGVDYRQLGMKDKLPQMSTPEALAQLSENGNLVKRPFLIDPEQSLCLIGFKENEWADTFDV